jgi:subtilisin family serine protease
MARSITYFVDGKRRRLEVQGIFDARQVRQRASTQRARGAQAFSVAPQRMGIVVEDTLKKAKLGDLFEDPEPDRALIVPADRGRTSVVPTATVVVEQARAAVIKKLKEDHGLEVVREGRQSKVMLRVPGDAVEAVFEAAKICQEVVTSGASPAAYPNFIRVLQRPAPSTAATGDQWNLDNPGAPGVVGADVAAHAAWTVTKGSDEVRVAVLDEGVDSNHPMLKSAVVAELDVVDGNSHARPDGDDAHGTACAGIIAARSRTLDSLASGVSIVAARIAKSDSQDMWLFDDFETADAIDWCWDDAAADVLSNSWGGGAASDAIRLAVERARTEGRGGKGSVVVFAAGNTQQEIGFPANLEGLVTVGASNQWDERKTRTSQDGEDWWGSNFGPKLDLVAPGVAIRTTDISGKAGYSPDNITDTFNGTSSATPHVAAALGLALTVNPTLTEAQAREVLDATCDRVAGQRSRNDQVGHGRLNAFAVVRAARRI